ncbi:pantoate--beta-alanine ligase [Bartonella sp. DGB2]|uniref:pantoate--beta-alanine ligase n=1 Tax=Bartonella sp. DGB2 TaxID=3388426 RepID=UPI00399025C5
MKVFQEISSLRQELAVARAKGATIGLVPTMGALHEGHLELVRYAQSLCAYSVVSIFVNPKQFGPREDFDAYPRDLARDCAFLKAARVNYVFAPSLDEMWPKGNQTLVDVARLSRMLIGRLRPGHFRGVTSVVAKLFNIVQPSHAFFGEKDFQQITIIRQMVRDLAFPVEIIGVPTQRDDDGVARSSRNQFLTPEDRQAAAIIPTAIAATQKLYEEGERSCARLRQRIRACLSQEPRAVVEAIDLRDARTLAQVHGKLENESVILLTVRFGSVRLIDQHILHEAK